MRYTIWDEMRRMREQMDRLFEESFRKQHLALAGEKGSKEVAKRAETFSRAPIADVQETEKSVIATFEMPGTDKKDIELNVNETSIEVKAQRKMEKEVKDEKKGYYRYASSSAVFYRALPLPARVEANSAVAVYKDGVLRVEIPKQRASESSKKRIDIK